MKHEDLHLGVAKVKPYRGFVKDTKKNLTGLILDGVIVAMFVLTFFMMYNAIVWSIWS